MSIFFSVRAIASLVKGLAAISEKKFNFSVKDHLKTRDLDPNINIISGKAHEKTTILAQEKHTKDTTAEKSNQVEPKKHQTFRFLQ